MSEQENLTSIINAAMNHFLPIVAYTFLGLTGVGGIERGVRWARQAKRREAERYQRRAQLAARRAEARQTYLGEPTAKDRLGQRYFKVPNEYNDSERPGDTR